jgi:hypothetical protein
MSTGYPAAIDYGTTLPNPSANSYTNNPSHAGLHDNANDAIKALETKIGIGTTGQSPPGNNWILTSNGLGQSKWQAPPAAGVWGLITGTLTDQTDLLSALATKLSLSGGTLSGNLLLNADPTAALGAATKQYVDSLGSTTLVRNETPGGTVNGSNTAFTTAATFATGSLKVYLNGQRLAPGSGIDYVEVTQGFTMQYAPATGDVLLVDYETTNTTRFVQGSNSIIVQETPTGTVNGSTTLFTVLQSKYVANSLEVFINGIQQTKTTDYTETSPGSGTFTFTTAPATGQVVKVSYQFATGASGNADTVDGFHASSTPTAGNILPLDGNGKLPASVLNTTAIGQYGKVIKAADQTTNASAFIDELITYPSSFNLSSANAANFFNMTASSEINIVTTGRYKITINYSTSGLSAPTIRKNGSVLSSLGYQQNADHTVFSLVYLDNFTAGDKLTIYNNSSTSSKTIYGTLNTVTIESLIS